MFWTAVLIILSLLSGILFFRSFADLIGRAILPYLIIASTTYTEKDIPKEVTDLMVKKVTEGAISTGFRFIIALGILYFLGRSIAT